LPECEAVIASWIPIYDKVGKVPGQELYADRNVSPDGIGRTVVLNYWCL